MTTRRISRPLYVGVGILFVALGYLGAIVPIMPSTVFFLMALWAFERSSPRFEDWLLNRSFIGPSLRDWRESRSIKPRTKLVAIATIWVTMIGSSAMIVLREKPLWIPPLMGAIGLAVSWYIATRPTGLESELGREVA
ncbi:MAG TPA: YbaN family protein [Fimbriimonas sp.]